MVAPSLPSVGVGQATSTNRNHTKKAAAMVPFLLYLLVAFFTGRHTCVGMTSLWRDASTSVSASTSADNTNDGGDASIEYLPIVPNISGSSPPLDHFFATYPKGPGGWVDVNKLSMEAVTDLRMTATNISGSEISCGYPKVPFGVPAGNDFEYCMWQNDVVSREALNDFSFEKSYWTWVAREFSSLYANRTIPSDKDASSDLHTNGTYGIPSDKDKDDECTELGFLDIGINVGDWISPIRLLVPKVPIYGIEGSPATAAIASANLRTSVEHHVRNKKIVGPSKVLPFSLAAESQTDAINQQGGVCFSKTVYHGGKVRAFNFGGRRVTAQSDCPPSDAAGATTLLHALEGLAKPCPALDWPNIFIAKIDVEGHEFKALSSVVSWLSTKPPCYIFMEYSCGLTSSVAMIELLTDLGYDTAWRPREGEFPDKSDPWWDHKKGGNLQDMLGKCRAGYTELLVGFSDVEGCVATLQHQV